MAVTLLMVDMSNSMAPADLTMALGGPGYARFVPDHHGGASLTLASSGWRALALAGPAHTDTGWLSLGLTGHSRDLVGPWPWLWLNWRVHGPGSGRFVVLILRGFRHDSVPCPGWCLSDLA